jgi:hypothetical protein
MSRIVEPGMHMKHYQQNDQSGKYGGIAQSRRPPDERHRPEHRASRDATPSPASRHNALSPAEVDEEIRRFFQLDVN